MSATQSFAAWLRRSPIALVIQLGFLLLRNNRACFSHPGLLQPTQPPQPPEYLHKAKNHHFRFFPGQNRVGVGRKGVAWAGWAPGGGRIGSRGTSCFLSLFLGPVWWQDSIWTSTSLIGADPSSYIVQSGAFLDARGQMSPCLEETLLNWKISSWDAVQAALAPLHLLLWVLPEFVSFALNRACVLINMQNRIPIIATQHQKRAYKRTKPTHHKPFHTLSMTYESLKLQTVQQSVTSIQRKERHQ